MCGWWVWVWPSFHLMVSVLSVNHARRPSAEVEDRITEQGEQEQQVSLCSYSGEWETGWLGAPQNFQAILWASWTLLTLRDMDLQFRVLCSPPVLSSKDCGIGTTNECTEKWFKFWIMVPVGSGNRRSLTDRKEWGNVCEHQVTELGNEDVIIKTQ